MTVIEVLEDMLAERRFGDPEKSYVSKLHHKGLDHILKKVGEEATEVVMAAKDAEIQDVISRRRLLSEGDATTGCVDLMKTLFENCKDRGVG